MTRMMKDSGIEWIGEIPENWEVSKVKYFVDCYDGKRVPVDSAQRIAGPYPYWGAGNITDYVNDYLFDEEIILLGEDGAPFFDPFRPVAFLINEKVWVNNHIHVLKPHETISSPYLVYFLNTVDYKSYINGSILNKLTQSNMNSIAFILPPLSEQQKIATFLDDKCGAIDEIISKTEQSIEEYKKLKQSVITKAVTKGIRPNRPMQDSNIEWIGEIPTDWATRKIFQLFTQVKNKNAEMVENNLLSLSYGKIIKKNIETSFGLLPESFETYNIIEKDDIVLRLTDLQNDHRSLRVGLCKERGIITSAYVTMRQKDNQYAPYLYYLLHTFDVKKGFYGMGDGVRQGLNWDELKHLSLVLPPPDEQKEITDYLDEKCAEIDTLVEKKQQFLAEMANYKKSLIYEYVTGKKEVA